jgi:hypothetical protein
MATVKSVLGYAAAALGIPIMVVGLLSFAGFNLGGPFLKATGLKTSANWTGGEVAQTIDHGSFRTEVHRPVFDALIGERREGFIQVAWRPPDSLPARIDEQIDTNADGQADFRVVLETATREAIVTPSSPNVMELEGVYDLGETLAIRVKLKNPRR